jgi:hypothetical protein
MELKEIEVGMVIHCKTQDQAWKLVRYGGLPSQFASRHWNVYESETCYHRHGFPDGWSYSDKNYFINEHLEVIEFEDLIIDERDTDYTLFSTKPVLDNYIVCELLTGEVFDFGGMCNASEVNGPNGNLVVFRYENGKKFLNLAAVPMSNIKLIRYINSREIINSAMSE